MYKYPNNPDNALICLFSNQIKEAENVLQYTLQLPFNDIESPELPDGSNDNSENISDYSNSLTNFFDTIGESVYDKCGYLFNYHNANIFGCKTYNVGDLSILSTNNVFWKHIFKQDMILSSFDKLRKLIGTSIPLKTYYFTQLANYTVDHTTLKNRINKTLHGLDYLTGCTENTSDNYLEITGGDNNTIFLEKKRFSSLDTTEWSAYGQNMKKNVEQNCKKLQDFNINNLCFEANPEQNISEEYLLYLSVLEFSQIILSQKKQGNDTKSFSIYPIINSHTEKKAFRYSQYEKYIHCISHMQTQSRIEALDRDIGYTPENDIPEHRLSLSDRIYLRYQIEKIFAPMMIDCMYRNIDLTTHTHNALDDQPTINRLSSCFTLPNVFTRQYIFQMAVDTLRNHSENGFDDSYFFSKYISNPTALMTKTRDSVDALRAHKALSVWLNRYESFINYLGHMLLPIYENLFFIKIWNCIRSKYPNDNESKCIVRLYKLLRQYLNNTDCVQKLFATEKTFWEDVKDIKQSNSKLKPDHILKPSFVPDQNIDTALYHKCILSQSITTKQKNVPEFLNLNYLNQYASDPTEKIQSFYIRSFIS